MEIASCEVTDRKLYIKAVNPRLQADVTPGDVVQSGICITNSEVGLGSFEASPLVYRLVCSNGMVVNDAAQKRKHIGAKAQQGEDYALYADETIAADDRAFMLKVRDTVRAIVDETQFDKVVAMMKASPLLSSSPPRNTPSGKKKAKVCSAISFMAAISVCMA